MRAIPRLIKRGKMLYNLNKVEQSGSDSRSFFKIYTPYPFDLRQEHLRS
jgi:hypothetical protein